MNAATTYEVGTGKTYANLEALRLAAVNLAVTWDDGDEIVLFGDDNSLIAEFDFNGKSIKMSGIGIISPSTTSNFSTTGSSVPAILTLDKDSSISFEGFKGFLNGTTKYGGAIYSRGDVTISSTSTFSNNSANEGGAIYARGDVTISGTSTFSGNSQTTPSGGAIYSEGNVTLIADTGNITFRGNIANSVPNAIYTHNDGNNKPLAILRR